MATDADTMDVEAGDIEGLMGIVTSGSAADKASQGGPASPFVHRPWLIAPVMVLACRWELPKRWATEPSRTTAGRQNLLGWWPS